jgi:CubicO group peptidase (beta-lactamase class C family)
LRIFSALFFCLFLTAQTGCASRIGNVVLPLKEFQSSAIIDAFLQERFAEDAELNPNAVLMVAVSRDGVTESFRYGDSTQYDKAYAIGSLSKTLTAALVAKLVREGRLVYEDKVHGSRIRSLLTHTAGIMDFGMDIDSLVAYSGFAWDGHGLYRAVDRQRLERVEQACAEDEFRYSSLGYSVLQKYLEERFKTSFATLMADEILKPTGMSRIQADPPFHERADGYPGEYPLFMRQGTRIPLEYSSQNSYMLAAAGYWARLDELVKLTESLRLGADYWSDLQTPVVDEGLGKRATVGLTLEKVNGVELAYKRGLSFGHSVYIGYYGQISVVVIRNSLRMTDEVGHSLLLGLGPQPGLTVMHQDE